MLTKKDVFIYYAKRSPIASFLKSFANISAVELTTHLINDLYQNYSNLKQTTVDQIILGQVLTCGLGQNPARQVVIRSNISNATTATSINQVCGSGLKAIILGAQEIQLNQANNILAGGQENMSMSKHYFYPRQSMKYGNMEVKDSLIEDGLKDAFNGIMMSETAQYLAFKYKISREEQDIFAFQSHTKAAYATQNELFKNEICSIKLPHLNNMEMIKDESIRYDTNLEKMSLLKSIVQNINPNLKGSITAGNSSTINDGAAILGLCSENYLEHNHLKSLAKIISYAEIGLEPMSMGLGPIEAVKKALKLANWSIKDVDLFEINEAFAAQVIICARELEIPNEKLNISGGAIALGHPIGASGARILVTLIHNLIRLNKHKGVAALCIGGGMGIAICIER